MILVGIVSYGKKNSCERGFPSVFTRVASYANSWIIPTMKSYSDSGEVGSSEERYTNADDTIDLREDYPISKSQPTDLSTFAYRNVGPRYNVIQPKQFIAMYPRSLLTIKYTYPIPFALPGNVIRLRPF